ncbi:MAG TPA: glycosyltransferase [Saprospiraceae bacterium]|nr:glycosyltransferase [Saprospiraceae bacterium]
MEIIHIVLGKANPERMNGVNKVVFQLATKQAESGRNVSVWGITKDPIKNFPERAFSTLLFPLGKHHFALDSTLKAAIKAHANKAVFHIHGSWVSTFWAVASTLKKYNARYIVTPHGGYNTIAMQKSALVKKMYFQLFEKNVLRSAYKIHCIGQSETLGLATIFDNNKSFLLPYGFESQPPTLAIANDSQKFIIGFVGRLDIYTKGLDLLVDAFEAFTKQMPQTELWILGDSDERETLQAMIIEKKLVNKVKLFGSKFGQVKENIMSEMHVFAHPSRNEGLPASVLEAASMGLPCIVSQATNVAETIEKYDAGIAVINESSKEITTGLMTLYAEWQKNKLLPKGENAKIMVKTHFAWSAILPQFDEMYGI